MSSEALNWEALGAGAEAISALATIITVVTAVITIRQSTSDAKDARKDAEAARRNAETARQQQAAEAKANRDQQAKIFQGTVMSNCTQEFFEIRSEAAQQWRSEQKHPPEKGKEMAAEHYAERMYGLHFEEYHLFRQQAIPCYIYAIWLKAIRDEIESAPTKGPESQYPPLDVSRHLTTDSAEDFHQFFKKVLLAKSHKEIELLATEESKKGAYD